MLSLKKIDYPLVETTTSNLGNGRASETNRSVMSI